MDIDAGPKVMGDDGEFHATDEAVDLSKTPFEAWAAVLLFLVARGAGPLSLDALVALRFGGR